MQESWSLGQPSQVGFTIIIRMTHAAEQQLPVNIGFISMEQYGCADESGKHMKKSREILNSCASCVVIVNHTNLVSVQVI